MAYFGCKNGQKWPFFHDFCNFLKNVNGNFNFVIFLCICKKRIPDKSVTFALREAATYMPNIKGLPC